MVGVTFAVTDMVIALEMAVLTVKQVALLVKMQVTKLPFAKELVVKLLLLVPAFTPFTCH